MAGQLTISTLNNDTGVLATQNGMTGIAKAWVTFNGTGTVAIRDSFNVSSITDNGTGDYTINFTTAMPNANYSWSVSRPLNTTGNSLVDAYTNDDGNSGSAPTTTAFRIISLIAGSVAQDSSRIAVTIFSS